MDAANNAIEKAIGDLPLNEVGISLLDLKEGRGRPDNLGADAAAPGSKHACRLIALEAMSRLSKKYGSCIEAQGPWMLEAASVWGQLGYGDDLASLDARYTRWIDSTIALRSQTSALIPQALSALAKRGWTGGALVLPGRVWRRDLRDKIHIGEPRQMDVWILRPSWRPTREDLLSLIGAVMESAAKKQEWRSAEAQHPYTEQGLEVEALWSGKWLEILECGLASPRVLTQSGLDGWGGLALGMGLDRMCMLRKGVPDIRRLDDPDPRAAAQCLDLAPWKGWSVQPGCSRDISVATSAGLDAERVVDVAARALSRPEWLEGIDVVGHWGVSELPEAAKAKLGMSQEQENWLLRLRMRDWKSPIDKALADEQARLAWDALHEGSSLMYRPTVGVHHG